jgi:hypothetical protein
VDIGAHELRVCVPGPENTQIVRAFGTYTADVDALADGLSEHPLQTVAMESTAVYWIRLFEVLQAHDFKGCLISATSLKRFPGRQSDVLDCPWIQTLPRHGLRVDSFRPEADLIAWRTLRPHRAPLLEHRLPRQKALWQMNLPLSQVLSRARPGSASVGQSWRGSATRAGARPCTRIDARRIKMKWPRPSPAQGGKSPCVGSSSPSP